MTTTLTKPVSHLTPGTVAYEQHMTALFGSGRKAQFRLSLLKMLGGLEQYAAAHRAAYHEPVGDDAVLGPAFASIASGVLGLLNGETGGFDAGSLDSNIREFMVAQGFNADTLDSL